MKIAISLVACLALAASGQNLLQNPSFESDLADWQSQGVAVVFSTPGQASDGVKFLAFNDQDRPATGVVWQSVVTVPGSAYELTFDIAGHFADAGRVRVDVFDGAGTGGTLIASSSFRNGPGGIVYERAGMSFTAESTTTTVVFTDTSTQTASTDLLIDNVRLVLTKEPNASVEYLFTAAVSFDTSPGITYSILHSESLEPGSWVEVGTVVGDGSRMTFYHPATSDRQFYEVKPK